MTKLDSIHPSLTHPTTSHFDHEPGNRLIVLVPPQAGDYPSQSHRIWEIASSAGLDVLLLSLCDDPYEESQLRRQLIMMAAMIGDAHICTEIKVENGHDWLRHVKSISQPGDVIACYAGQRVGLLQKPLHEVLRTLVETPIYILSLDQPIRNSGPKFLSQTAFWMGSLAIIGAFLWLEVKLALLPQDWGHNLLLYICVLAEFGILVLWNSIFTY